MKNQKDKKLHKLFIPSASNQYRPSFLENTSTVLFAIFVVGMFVFSSNSARILDYVSHHSQLSAVLPGVLIDLTNTQREEYQLAPLAENQVLNKAAELKAKDMASKQYFAHVSPDGKKPWNWLQDVQYEYQYAGENLAINFASSKDVTLAWMNSPTHKANIIKPNYTEIGTGVATGTYNGAPTVFIAQVYASPYTGSSNLANTADILAPFKTSIKNFARYILEHNHDVTNKLLIGFLAFVCLALVLKIFIHVRIQHGTLIRNGLLMCALISLLLLINNFINDDKSMYLDYSSYEYSINQNENISNTNQ